MGNKLESRCLDLNVTNRNNQALFREAPMDNRVYDGSVFMAQNIVQTEHTTIPYLIGCHRLGHCVQKAYI